MTRLRLRSRYLAIGLALVLVVAACGNSSPTSPSPTGSGAPSTSAGGTAVATATATASPTISSEEQAYKQIEAQVEAIRGLKPKQALTPTLLDEQGVVDYMTKAFNEQVDPKQFAFFEQILKHLGLVPVSADLKQMEIDLESSQVIGFYDAEAKQLFLVSTNGQVGALQKATFSHEYTHALQDQNFDLLKLIPQTGDQGDRDLSRTALIEGDATLVLLDWAKENLSFADLAELAGAGTGPQQDQLNKAPRILRESLMFPYTQGLAFVQHEFNAGGWSAIDAIYKNPPASTSQILHPDLYDQGVQPEPVTLPSAPAGFTLSTQDTFGEFQLGIWLGEGKTASQQTSATAAAKGWAGDRLGYYQSTDGKWAIVIRSTWTSASARAIFRQAAGQAAHEKGSTLQACTVGTLVNVVITSDSATASRFDCTK